LDRKSLIMQVLEGERVSRLPRALFGGGLWAFRQTDLGVSSLRDNPTGFAERLAELYGRLDTDIIFAGSGLNTFPAEAIGGDILFSGGMAPLLSFPLIQKADDARHFAEIDLEHAPHTLALMEMVRSLRQRLPDRFLCVTSWGPFTWAMILCNRHLLMDRTATDPEFIGELCELGVRLSCALFEPLAHLGLIDGISVPDGAVTLIPTKMYQDVVLPREKKLFDWARERGLKSFLHQCGNIASQVPLYPDTGADCISVDAGVAIGEVYNLYSGRSVTAGNVDVVNTLYGGDQTRICKAVNDCVSEISDPFRNYILMPSCDLPVDTPLKNAEAFLACADTIV